MFSAVLFVMSKETSLKICKSTKTENTSVEASILSCLAARIGLFPRGGGGTFIPPRFERSLGFCNFYSLLAHQNVNVSVIFSSRDAIENALAVDKSEFRSVIG